MSNSIALFSIARWTAPLPTLAEVATRTRQSLSANTSMTYSRRGWFEMFTQTLTLARHFQVPNILKRAVQCDLHTNLAGRFAGWHCDDDGLTGRTLAEEWGGARKRH